MNTFHINPSRNFDLACQAEEQVVSLMVKHGNGVHIAVRGASCEGTDDYLYGVYEAPHDLGRTEYVWTYVPAAHWLGQLRCEQKARRQKAA